MDNQPEKYLVLNLIYGWNVIFLSQLASEYDMK